MANENPSSNLADYGPTAFRGLHAEGAAADRLGWGLELIVLPAVDARGLPGLDGVIADLNRLGHVLVLSESVGGYREYDGPVTSGSMRLRMSATVANDMVSVSVTVESALPILRSPALPRSR